MHDPHDVADRLEDCFDREEAERLAILVWWIEHRGYDCREDVVEFLAESFTLEQAEGIVEVAGYREE
jgi:folate-dependent phosphoribosylglycinamide formyltransferase PurN